MATLNEYFRSEARDFLNSLERSLQRTPGPDAAELHRAVRGLRGTAQMAREQRVFDVITAFESVTRSIADGALAWSDHVAVRARDTIADLRALLDPTEDDESLDARANGAAARWRDTDPEPTTPAAAPTVDAGTRDFREFAAREAAEIADALDQGIQDLQADAMNRAPLTTILRRQRALLGSARLDEIPVISDILHAVEDLTRVIVKLDVGVKQEWLDIYRVARDALQTTIAPLLRDEMPQASNSVSRLRHMRAELLERYGSTEESARPPVDPFAAKPAAPAAPFMAPARSAPSTQPAPKQTATPGAAPAPPFATSASAAPLMPPIASTPSSRVAPAREPASRTQQSAPPFDTDTEQPAGQQSSADLLELTEAVGAEDAVLELSEDNAVGDAVLELDDEAAVDVPVLDLSEEAAVDDAVLELNEDSAVTDAVLELGEDAAVDASTLDLDEDAIVADLPHDVGVLEFGQTDQSEGEVLEFGQTYQSEGEVLELGEDSAAKAHPAVQPGDDMTQSPPAADPLARALELRAAIDRVAAHDPAARAAVDELYSLIRQALG